MKVKIEFELDVDSMDDGWIDDYMADLTYDMRASRYLVSKTWSINY